MKHIAGSKGNVELSARDIAQAESDTAAWTASIDDRAFAALRRERDSLLTKTDWWVTRGSITEEQTSYRQALRDLPANTVNPANVTWPMEPGD